MIKNVFGYISFFICVFCFLALVFSIILDHFLMNPSQCLETHKNLHTSIRLNLGEKDLKYVIDNVFYYLKSDNDNIDLIINVSGKNEHIFTNDELIHLKDIKSLYNNFLNFTKVLFVCFFISLILSFVCKVNIIKNIKTIIIIIVISVFLILILFLLLMYNFNSFWFYLHKLLFNNDLWMLDPLNDKLIMLFPRQFFVISICKISICYIISLILFVSCVLYCDKKVKN